MTIASVGNMGSAAGFASNGTGALTTQTTAMAAGDFGIMTVVTDNLNTGAVDADNNEHVSVSGGTGTWTKRKEWSNNNGGAGSGVTISVWTFESTGVNAIGTVFTITFSAPIAEKTVVMHCFSKAAGTRIALDPSAGTNPITSQLDASNDFGSSAFAGLPNASRLYFRAMGKEANTAVDITASANFITTARTRSQNAASAVCVRGEYRINTSTGETSNPVLAASGDTAGLFLALIEEVIGTAAVTLDGDSATSDPTGSVGVLGTLAQTEASDTSTSTVPGVDSPTWRAFVSGRAVPRVFAEPMHVL